MYCEIELQCNNLNTSSNICLMSDNPEYKLVLPLTYLLRGKIVSFHLNKYDSKKNYYKIETQRVKSTQCDLHLIADIVLQVAFWT